MLSDPGEQRGACLNALLCVDFCSVKNIVYPIITFEAPQLQLSLAAYYLDYSVLNLWDYPRRPRVLYPVAGLSCWSGTLTRWNSRPCLAALTPLNFALNLEIHHLYAGFVSR